MKFIFLFLITFYFLNVKYTLTSCIDYLTCENLYTDSDYGSYSVIAAINKIRLANNRKSLKQSLELSNIAYCHVKSLQEPHSCYLDMPLHTIWTSNNETEYPFESCCPDSDTQCRKKKMAELYGITEDLHIVSIKLNHDINDFNKNQRSISNLYNSQPNLFNDMILHDDGSLGAYMDTQYVSITYAVNVQSFKFC